MEQSSPVIERIQAPKKVAIQMYSQNIVLYAHVPNYETAQAIVEEVKKGCGIDGTNWLEEVKRLKDCGTETQKEDVEVQYFKIGKWCL